MKRVYGIGAVLAILVTGAAPARADLIGKQVQGSLTFGTDNTNYFLPANGFVPAGYGNSAGQPVTIGAGTEFGFSDPSNTDTADFTGTSLTIRDLSNSGSTSFIMTFTSLTPGLFTGFTAVSDSFGGSLTLSGDTLTFTAPDTLSGDTRTAVYTINTDTPVAQVAEPVSLALLATGLFGMAMVRRRT